MSDPMDRAQLYWDDQDPKNVGWWLRYYDDRGVEQGLDVSESQDATTHELAAAIEAAIGVDSTLTNTIKIFHNKQPLNSIHLINNKTKN